MVVHCEAGMSRSPAVAAAIAEHLGDDPLPYFARYTPNAHVFRMLRDRLAFRCAQTPAADSQADRTRRQN